MRKPTFVLALAVAAALAREAAAQPEEGQGATPPAADPAPAPATDPAPAPLAGITPEALAALPRLDPRARADMRAACEADAPACDRLLLLGRLERAALLHALGRRGLVVDAAPQGKRIGRIHVVTLPPFGQEVAWLTWANVFHIDSKPHILAREVLARPGDVWDQEVVDESQRKLRDPLFATVAVIVPVRPADSALDADTVDLLLVNRDIFSLRLNTNYEYRDGQLAFLATSLSENNFLGRRKLAALTLTMDQGSIALGPLYIDKNLLGRQLDFRFRGGPILERATGELEGSEATVTFGRPLWSLDSRWAWDVDATHGNSVERSFSGTGLRRFDADGDPATTADQVPWRYRLRRWSVGGGVTRAWGEKVEQRLRLRYQLSSRRPEVQDDLAAATPVDVLAAFEREVLPRSERAGVATLSYEVFTARYRDYVDVDSFDLAEDIRLGPRLSVSVGAGPRLLGSENPFATAAIEGGWTVPWAGDGVASLAASFATRLDHGDAIDRSAAASLRVVSPAARVGRLVGEVRLAGLFREEGNRFLTLGGDSGLRGFPGGAFAGLRRAIAQVEARSRSIRFLFGVRWGVLAFYDVGHAARTVDELSLQHDVGLGLRTLTPQLSREVFRFDLAFPLTGPGRGSPRLILGYRQAF